MNATITYRVGNIPYPWDEKRRLRGDTVWAVIKVIKPEFGRSTEEAVAIFNLDSEARMFQGHIYAAKLDGKLITIDQDIKDLCKEGSSLW